MNSLQNFITEGMANPSFTKPEKLAGNTYAGAIGFIEGKGNFGGVIIGEPFTMDDDSTRKNAASLATKDFSMKVDLEDLINAIEKNKSGNYDVVLKKDKYKGMQYVYFVPNKFKEVYCCLYSQENVYLKGNRAFVFEKI